MINMRNSSTVIFLVLLAAIMLMVNWFYFSEGNKTQYGNNSNYVSGVAFNGKIENAPSSNMNQGYTSTSLINAPSNGASHTFLNVGKRSVSSGSSLSSGAFGSHYAVRNTPENISSSSGSSSNSSVGGASSESYSSVNARSQSATSLSSSNEVGGLSLNLNSDVKNKKNGISQVFSSPSASTDQSLDVASSNQFGGRQKSSMQTMDAPIDGNLVILMVLSAIFIFVKRIFFAS
jgi:hypothetical protein